MDRPDSLHRHALAAVAVAALALAGCQRNAPPDPTAGGSSSSSETTTTASNSSGGTASGSGSVATGSPGMSGSPGAGGRDANAAGNLNTLPPTAAGTMAAASGVSGGTAGGSATPLADADRKFVTEAAAGGMFEVQVSKLAADKATDPAVKTFASMLVTDHSNANDELKAFASAHDVTLPTSLPKDKQAQLDKLQKATGKDFDKQYAQAVGIKDHKQDIAKFEKASKDAKNPELKAWVDKTLPTLKEHLAAAQKLPENGAKTASTR